ncbi:MAG: rhodanese-like domain-containing protein [Chitinophagaceae bacterium]|nr:rhodanese-like domain-containing protein [Chitinophagaceae bacterium]
MKKCITPVEMQQLRNSIDDVVVMDVRTPEEYNEFHIPGSMNVPLALFKLESFQPPTGVVVVTVCNGGGGRSELAADLVNLAGGSPAFYLDGGIRRWQREQELSDGLLHVQHV